MQYIYPSGKIYLAKSDIPKAGRGVFTNISLKKDDVIEVAPVIVLPQSDYIHTKQTLLRNYFFLWSEKQQDVKTLAIGLGFASLYNHSYEAANATYIKDITEKTITFVALRDIPKDKEILVNYNFGNPDDKTPLWITDISKP